MQAAETVGDWCSQSEAAQRLSEAGDTLTQQQVSRYLERFPELPRRKQANGLPTLVDFAALSKHRSENIRVQDRVDMKSPANDDDAADLRLRERKAAAEIRELDLAKARNEVIPRAAVERAVQAAAMALQQAHRRTRFERADELEATNDLRAKVGVLEKHDSAVEAAFAQALAALAASEPGQEQETEEETPAQPTQDTQTPALASLS